MSQMLLCIRQRSSNLKKKLIDSIIRLSTGGQSFSMAFYRIFRRVNWEAA